MRRSTGEKKVARVRGKHLRVFVNLTGKTSELKQANGKPKLLPRTVHVAVPLFTSREWTWKVQGPHVLVLNPIASVLYFVPTPVVTGMSYDGMERGRRKGYWVGVTPSMVKAWIEKLYGRKA